MCAIGPHVAGAASGVHNTTQQLGGVAGSAVVGAVLAAQLAAAGDVVAAMRPTLAVPVLLGVLGAVGCLAA